MLYLGLIWQNIRLKFMISQSRQSEDKTRIRSKQRNRVLITWREKKRENIMHVFQYFVLLFSHSHSIFLFSPTLRPLSLALLCSVLFYSIIIVCRAFETQHRMRQTKWSQRTQTHTHTHLRRAITTVRLNSVLNSQHK